MNRPPTPNAAGSLVLRAAKPNDSAAIARVFSPSLRLLSFLPSLHSVEEDRWFIENVILAEATVIVVTSEDVVVAFLARQGEEIRLLHTHPDFIGRGAGGLLIEHAKSCATKLLELWCFQKNTGARRFYERHGFRPTLFTDGSRNEEKEPDILYRWERKEPME